jgi:hypothetical protein
MTTFHSGAAPLQMKNFDLNLYLPLIERKSAGRDVPILSVSINFKQKLCQWKRRDSDGQETKEIQCFPPSWRMSSTEYPDNLISRSMCTICTTLCTL